MIALCYAELGTMFPFAGSEYIYLKYGLGDWAGFLFIWVNFFFIDGASRAVDALAFANYFSHIFFSADASCQIPEELPVRKQSYNIHLVESQHISIKSYIPTRTSLYFSYF